jgi:NAD(P)-dependent dehydrogenase (short-subunit alcohol dehydrogenase family)
MDLKDKIIVITGSTKGFGKALASQFINEGSKVIISSDNKKDVETVSKDLNTTGYVADVTSISDVEGLAANVISEHGVIDMWINNAGIQIAPSNIEDINPNKFRRLFEINLFGYFYGCKIALSHMKKQGHGVIININSTAGLEGKSGISAYSSSKWAVKGLTESIRKENTNPNIKVFAVYPGGMKTDIYKEKYPTDLDEYMDVGLVSNKVVENLKSETPETDLIIRRPKNL